MLLQAAIVSGPETEILTLTNKLYRETIECNVNEIQSIFLRWKCQSIRYLNRSDTNDYFLIEHPLKFKMNPYETHNSWHLPYHNDSDKLIKIKDFNKMTRTWLCFQL